MNDTILLVAHGSRGGHGNSDVEMFAATWRSRRQGEHIVLCYLAFADLLLADGLELAAQGARRVLVVPLFLGSAAHVKVDIPSGVAAARQRHVGVEFLIADHLGPAAKVVDALNVQLDKALHAPTVFDEKFTGVVLLGRGSSDMEANAELVHVADCLRELNNVEILDVAFSAIIEPELEAVVARYMACCITRIVVLPYYLFSGVLTERIADKVTALQTRYPEVLFVFADCIGLDEAMYDLLDQRLNEVRERL